MKNITYLLIISILFIGLCVSVHRCSNLSDVYDKNIAALTDTIKLEKNKNGDIVASKYILECEVNNLKYINEGLYDEIDKLNIKKSKLEYALSMQGQIEYDKNDTTYVIQSDTVYKGFTKKFNFDDSWRQLSGEIEYIPDSLKFKIDKDIVNFDYTIGVDKNNRVYITSENPYVKYNNISGFKIPSQKSHRFSVGPSIGLGYGFIHNRCDVFVGATLTWNLLKF